MLRGLRGDLAAGHGGGGAVPLLTASAVARLKGCSTHAVTAAVRRGELRAEQIGTALAIDADAARAWRPRTKGRPKKSRHRASP